MSLLQMIQNYKQNKKNLSESINLIPMINLIFLLLIFFLLTGVIQKKDNPEISIPESSEGVKKTYDIKFPDKIIFTPQTYLWLDEFVDCSIFLIKIMEL